MENIEKKIEAKKKELELLELEKREAELKIEIKKIQKTTIEENVVVRRTIYRDEYVPNYLPSYPVKPIWQTWPSQTIFATGVNNVNLAKLLNN